MPLSPLSLTASDLHGMWAVRIQGLAVLSAVPTSWLCTVRKAFQDFPDPAFLKSTDPGSNEFTDEFLCVYRGCYDPVTVHIGLEY